MKLSELAPRNQTQLFNYKNLFLNIVSLHKQRRLPKTMLFSGPKGVGKATFSYHIINYIFSKDETFSYDIDNFQINSLNKSYNLILNKTHPNFFLINLLNNKNVIEISQIREMINYTNKSSFNNKEKIILIDNAENLNINSSNALLKIIEEPNENVFFILIFDNNKKILDTLKSRCLCFNFAITYEECVETSNNIIGNNIYNLFSEDLINHYSTVGDFVNLAIFSSTSNLDICKTSLKDFLIYLIDEKIYKKDTFIKHNIYKYIELYLIKLLNFKRSRKQIFLKYETFIKKINNIKKFNLDEESFFIEFKTKIFNE